MYTMVTGSVTKEKMLRYLQSMTDNFVAEEEKYGMDDFVEKKLDALLACKDMVEALIEMPVNIGLDGKVTVGF